MSNGIYVHFHLKSGRRAPSEVMAKMVAAMSQWEEAENEWRSLKVFDGALDHCIVEQYGTMTAGQILAATKTYRAASTSIWSDVSFRCWHTAAGRPFQGVEGATMIVRGDAWLDKQTGDRRLRGNAELAIWERAPFKLLDTREFGSAANNWNRYVEENLEVLTAGIFRLIEALKPISVKVYDGFGDFLPLNANLAYYRSESDVVADVKLLAEIWERGDDEGGIPPLKLGYSNRARSVLGVLRTESSREKIWKAMTRVLPNVARLNERHVRAVLASGSFDYYAMPVGFTLLDHPGFMNSYLNAFFIALLEEAGQK